MTLRTTLLAVCMVAVPTVALFSHRVPSCFRARVREAAAAAAEWCHDAVTSRRQAAVPPAPETDSNAVSSDSFAVAASPPSDASPGGTETLLAGLGARSLECRPLPGPNGGQAASCTVPLDADGQLLRVFNATGSDRDAALAALVNEVEGWRRRIASAPRQPPPAVPSRH